MTMVEERALGFGRGNRRGETGQEPNPAKALFEVACSLTGRFLPRCRSLLDSLIRPQSFPSPTSGIKAKRETLLRKMYLRGEFQQTRYAIHSRYLRNRMFCLLDYMLVCQGILLL